MPADLSADEKHAYDQLAFFFKHGLAYAQEMDNRPQTLYAIEDSPVRLAAWIAELAYPNLIHYNKLDKGGHFAAWEQPKLFTQEIRTAFRSIR